MVSNHAGQLFRRMFPDSKIAKEYSAARTKTSNIICSLADNDAKTLVGNVKNHPYSIATDGSTDQGVVKLYPVLLKTFDENIGQVVCELLSLKKCSEGSTGENIFKIMDTELKNWGISWNDCVSFVTDKCISDAWKTEGSSSIHTQRKFQCV